MCSRSRTLVSFAAAIALTLLSVRIGAQVDNSGTALGLVSDAAGLFNERGYSASNSVDVDGSEVINDFNGNLMFSRTLNSTDISQNGLHSELRIAYNGSVGHMVASGLGHQGDGTQRQLNINLPEWIISLNGIALQTFNFESEAISWADPGGEDGESMFGNVSALVNGYHTCYANVVKQEVQYGSVSILMGDGSVSQFTSESDAPEHELVRLGEYRTYSRDDLTRGYMWLDTTGCLEGASYRRVVRFRLFKADGSMIDFIRYIPKWLTELNTNKYGANEQPMIFMPVQFLDHQGHSVSVSYDFTATCRCCDGPSCDVPVGTDSDYFGRPLVTSAGGYEFDWQLPFDGNGTTLDLRESGSSEYRIRFHADVAYGAAGTIDGVNRAQVTSITDAEGRTTAYGYAHYRRQGTGFSSGTDVLGKTDIRYVATSFELYPMRLAEIKYPEGGSTYFSYYDDSRTLWPSFAKVDDVLSIDFSESCLGEVSPCLKSEAFDAMGRDPYFTNIVIGKRRVLDYVVNTVPYDSLISWDSWSFSWDNPGEEWGEFEISSDDTFRTTKKRMGRQTESPGNPWVQTEMAYKQYPERGIYHYRARDRGWVIRLVEETTSARNTVEESLSEVSYRGQSWNIFGPCQTWRDSCCDGTFQLETVTTRIDGASGVPYTDSLSTDWINDDDTTRLTNNFTAQASSNPWGISTTTFYDTTYCDTITDTGAYYMNNLIDSTTSMRDGTLISKSASDFCGESDASGYLGQPKRSIVYEIAAGTVVDSLVTRYEYNKTSYTASTDLGSLHKVVNPAGDSTVFHYQERVPNPLGYVHPKDDEDAINPVLLYEVGGDSTRDRKSVSFNRLGASWYRADNYLTANSIVITDTILTDVDPTILTASTQQPGSDVESYTIMNRQKVGYQLELSKGGKAGCEDGSYAKIYLNDLLMDAIYCSDSYQLVNDDISADSGDVVKVAVLNTSENAGTYKATFRYTDPGDEQGLVEEIVYDTVGDAIVTHQWVDNKGRPLKIVGPNGFLSNLYYDYIDRVDRVTLPYSHQVDTCWDSLMDSIESGVACDRSADLIFSGGWTYWVGTSGLSNSDTVIARASGPGNDTAIVLAFEDLDLDDIPNQRCVDSAFLYVYVKSINPGQTVCLRTLTDQEYYCHSTQFYDRPISVCRNISGTGLVRLNVGPIVKHWRNGSGTPRHTKLFMDLNQWDGSSMTICSDEHADPDKRPNLKIYYSYENPPENFFSMRFNYDDNPAGGGGPTVTTLTRHHQGVDTFDRTNRVRFDAFRRPLVAYSVDSAGTEDSVETVYDYADRTIETYDQQRNKTEAAHDGLNRARRTVYPTVGGTSASDSIAFSSAQADDVGLADKFTFYDSNLYVTTVLDENDNWSVQYSDILKQLRLTVRYFGSDSTRTYFDYDDYGNLTTVIKPKGDSVNYRYNSFGQLVKEWAADYDTVFYRYDISGNMILKQDGILAATPGGAHDSTLMVTESASVANGLGRDVDTIPISHLGIMHYSYILWGQPIESASYVLVRINGTVVDSVDGSICVEGMSYCLDDGYCYVEPGYLVELEATIGDPDSSGTSTTASAQIDGAYYALCDTDWWAYNDYDALNRVTASGKILLEETCDADSCWFSDTSSQSTYRRWFYDQGKSALSKGRLSLAVDDRYNYAEKYDYDPRGRIHRQTDYFQDGVDFLESEDVQPLTGYPNYEFFIDDNNRSYETDYVYNFADQITRINYPDALADSLHVDVTYHYDQRGRLISVGRVVEDEGEETEVEDYFASITYTERNEIEAMTLGNGIQQVDYIYNERGWLTSINDNEADSGGVADRLGQWLHYYDDGVPDPPVAPGNKNGNITAQELEYSSGNPAQYFYEYDGLDRLTKSNWVTGADEFTYDKNGNRLTLESGGHTQYYQYQDDNQMDSVYHDSALVLQKYLYDKNGNAKWAWDYNKQLALTYDIDNQLRAVHDEPTDYDQVIYGYSAGGLRVWKWFIHEVDTCTAGPLGGLMMAPMGGGLPPLDSCEGPVMLYDWTYYVRGQSGNVLAEYVDLDGQPVARYIYAGSQRIAMLDSLGNVYYYLNDHLGSAGVLIASDGTVQDRYRYKAFGEAESGQSVNVGQAYRYTGKPLDEDLGLDWYYYGARYYDPNAGGRFLSVDRLHNEYPGLSPYVYTLNNPLKYSDPSGLKPYDIFHTMDAAAMDFGQYYNAESIMIDREYASSIFSREVDGRTEYYYNAATVGISNAVSPGGHGGCSSCEIISAVHTHGAYAVFNSLEGAVAGNSIMKTSEADMSLMDIGYGKVNGMPVYLVNPSGELLKFDNQTGEVTMIAKGLPSDPYGGIFGTFAQIQHWLWGLNLRDTGEKQTIKYTEVDELRNPNSHRITGTVFKMEASTE